MKKIIKRRILAFTLIELLIVIVILGVLAALISGNFITSLKKGRDARRKADLNQIQQALEMYYEDKKVYPPSINFGKKFCESTPTDPCPATDKVYMQKLPNDPINGKNYEYKYDAPTKSYKLYACLDNNLQVLPYESSGYSIPCGTCEYPAGTPERPCIWGISSSNVSP